MDTPTFIFFFFPPSQRVKEKPSAPCCEPLNSHRVHTHRTVGAEQRFVFACALRFFIMSHTQAQTRTLWREEKRRVAETYLSPLRRQKKKFTDGRAGGRSAQGNQVAKVLPAIKTSFLFYFFEIMKCAERRPTFWLLLMLVPSSSQEADGRPLHIVGGVLLIFPFFLLKEQHIVEKKTLI